MRKGGPNRIIVLFGCLLLSHYIYLLVWYSTRSAAVIAADTVTRCSEHLANLPTRKAPNAPQTINQTTTNAAAVEVDARRTVEPFSGNNTSTSTTPKITSSSAVVAAQKGSNINSTIQSARELPQMVQRNGFVLGGAPSGISSNATAPVANTSQVASTITNVTGNEADIDVNITKVLKKEQNRSKCGILYYYHVSKTGGNSVKAWIRKLARDFSRDPRVAIDIKFINLQDLAHQDEFGKKASFEWVGISNEITDVIDSKILSNASSNTTWAIVHQHHLTPGLHYMIHPIREWRRKLQDQGCSLILTTTLREPYEQSMSVLNYAKGFMQENETFDMEVELRHKRDGQVNYLLYNKCERGVDYPKIPDCHIGYKQTLAYISTPQEVQELLDILTNDFDVIGQTDYLREFADAVLELTSLPRAWQRNRRPSHTNKSSKTFKITPKCRDIIADVKRDDIQLWNHLFGDSRNVLESQ